MNRNQYSLFKKTPPAAEEILPGRYAERDRCLMLLFYNHGLSASELADLKVNDIDIDNREIHSWNEQTKWTDSQPLSAEEVAALKVWLNGRYYWKNSHSPWLFISQKSEKLCRQQVYRIVRGKKTLAPQSLPSPAPQTAARAAAAADVATERAVPPPKKWCSCSTMTLCEHR